MSEEKGAGCGEEEEEAEEEEEGRGGLTGKVDIGGFEQEGETAEGEEEEEANWVATL